MSIVVSVKVRDGIVLGADSATQIHRESRGEIQAVKIFYNAQKLFQVAGRPLGLLTWGAGNIGSRSVQGVLDDYSEQLEGAAPEDRPEDVEDVAISLRSFLEDRYREELEGIPTEEWPSLGVFVAGYSPDVPHGEEWEFEIPGAPPEELRDPTQLGASWRGAGQHISRAVNGYDPRLAHAAGRLFERYAEDADDLQRFQEIFQAAQSNVVFDGMPLQEAVYYAEFLLNITKGFERFETGAPKVGGPLRLACITRHKFRWLTEQKIRTQEETTQELELVR